MPSLGTELRSLFLSVLSHLRSPARTPNCAAGDMVDTLDRDMVDAFRSVKSSGKSIKIVYIPPPRRDGNVEISPRLVRFPKDGGKVGKALFAFPSFPPSCHFHPV